MNIGQLLYSLPLRLRSFFHPNQVDQETKEELREHLEQQISAMGGSLRSNNSVATSGVESSCGIFIQDLRYGVRQLRRSPGFSALVILCLTLGIGANAAVFSWVEAILFRPYPLVAHQERLFAVAGTVPGKRIDGLSWPDFLTCAGIARFARMLSSIRLSARTLNIGDHAEVTTGSMQRTFEAEVTGSRTVVRVGSNPTCV
jgi:hypothetical protein